MVDRVLCPRLVGRDEQLFVLEDALLAAHGGESRFVAVGGEAGIGKTRLASELAKRARRLGWAVLWGACSEAELPLPYLPLVEALGNYISLQGAERVGNALGAARRELAQLFPQLAGDEFAAPAGDPAQGKLRLFEAIVALLAVPAHEQGVLLVVEDVHWADSATRELLDHLARRMTNMRSMLLLTYRSDELDRRHPLAPLVQMWRRSGVAEFVVLSPLAENDIAEMIAAILDEQRMEPELRDLLSARSEGNPFVLEEMLKEAIDHANGGPRSLDGVRIPETVRDAILLRFARIGGPEAQVPPSRRGARAGPLTMTPCWRRPALRGRRSSGRSKSVWRSSCSTRPATAIEIQMAPRADPGGGGGGDRASTAPGHPQPRGRCAAQRRRRFPGDRAPPTRCRSLRGGRAGLCDRGRGGRGNNGVRRRARGRQPRTAARARPARPFSP